MHQGARPAPEHLPAQRVHGVADVALDVALLAAVPGKLGHAAADQLRLAHDAVLVHYLHQLLLVSQLRRLRTSSCMQTQ